MRKSLLVLLSILVVPSVSEGKLKKSMEQQCLVCHENWLLESKINSPRLLLSRSVDAADRIMCLSCHDGSLADDREAFLNMKHFSHPIDITVPSDFKIPSKFPLRNGKLYCGTCHTPHSSAGSQKKLDFTFMREANSNSNMCIDCHRENAAHGMNHPVLKDTEGSISSEEAVLLRNLGAKVGSNGEVVCESCHSAHEGKAKNALIASVRNSQLCSICHQQEVNSDQLPNPRNHRIHVSIPDYMSPAPMISKRLNNGRLECLTCHKVHKESNEKLTVLPPEQLCSSCHTPESPVIHSPHNQDHQGCIMCHTPHRAKTDEFLFKVVPASGKYCKDYDISSKVCISCHNGGVAKVTVGPLSHSHKGECTACHDPHVWDPEHPDRPVSSRARGNRFNSFLKMPSPQLCITCHGKRSVEGTFHDFSGSRINTKNVLGEKLSEAGLCESCHTPHKAVGPYLWGIRPTAKARKYMEELNVKDQFSETCLTCHYPGGIGKDVGKISHPVGQKCRVNSDLPLSRGGTVTCGTCHDPHRWAAVDGSKERAATEFLRVPEWTLCLKCHSDKIGVMVNAHSNINDVNVLGETPDSAGACAACHVPHRAVGKFLQGVEGKSGSGNFCLVCHGTDGVARDKVMQSEYPDHPMGVKNPAKDLPGSVITCFTCHDPHATLEFLLRKKVSGNSELCLSCHRDKDVTGSSHDFLKADIPLQEKNEIARRGNCSACHTPHNPKFKLLWSRNPGQGDTINSRMCSSCHAPGKLAGSFTVGKHTHPIGKDTTDKNLQMITYSGLPLIDQNTGCPADRGIMDCATCHDPHNGKDKQRLTRLTVKGDSKLCIACHTEQARVIGTDHDMRVVKKSFKNVLGENVLDDGVCSACHVPHRATGIYLWALDVKRLTGNPLEDYCLTCHSRGGIARDTVEYYFHPSKKQGIVIRNMDRPGREGNWPIFNDKGREVKVGGKIVCETCHNPHVWSRWSDRGPGKPVEGSIENSFLRNSTIRGSICVDCHGIEALYRYKFFHSKSVHTH